MSNGASKCEAAAEMGCDYDSLLRYEKKYPAFCGAIKIAVGLSQAWWERLGRLGIRDKDFQCALWFMNMKNRFKEDWRDKHEVNVTGTIVKKYEGLSWDELKLQLAGKMAEREEIEINQTLVIPDKSTLIKP